MGLSAESKREKKVPDNPAMSTHMARLVGLVDLGHQPGFSVNGREYPSKWKTEFIYELPNSLTRDGRPHWAREDVNQDDFEGKGLTSKMMARVRSLDPDNESNNGKSLIKLLGKPCMVTLTPNKNNYPKIKGIPDVTAIPLGIEVPPLVNEPFAFDMENPDLEIWEQLGRFTREKIQRALNYKETDLYRQLTLQDDM